VICIPSIVEGLGAGWGHDGTHTQRPPWPRSPRLGEGRQFGEASQFVALCSRGVSCLQQTITAPKVQRLPLRDMSGGYPTKGLRGLFLTAPSLPLTILVETSGSSTSPRAYTSKTRACRYISRPAPTSAVATAMPLGIAAYRAMSSTLRSAPTMVGSGSAPSWTAARPTGGSGFYLIANRHQPRARSCAGSNLSE
jgi:hypothetical protein